MLLETNSSDGMNNLNNHRKTGLVLIWFYATWCGHCVNMESDWEKLSNNHPEEVNLAQIESEEIPQYQKSPGEDDIRGFPTIRLYHRDKLVKEYDGERSFQNIYDFLQEYINNNPETKLNNITIVKSAKTNKVNSKLLETMRKNKRIKKLSVKKFKRKPATKKPKKPKKPKATKKRKRSPSSPKSPKKLSPQKKKRKKTTPKKKKNKVTNKR